MEILISSTSKTIPFPFFCNPKTLHPKFSSNCNKPFLTHRNHSPFYLTTSISRKFQTWAHFGRPSNRRNSLRNKLLHDNQVRLKRIPNDPSSVSSNDVAESDVSFQRVVVNNESVVELEKEKSKLLGESVMLNKLENWVDQYSKDIEFWGIGSAPIFTVYEDLLGGVKRVLVDEDEILKRVRVQKGGNEVEDLSEVKCKILEAKKLARDMESGDNVIARNSSVAKFVVQGKEEKGEEGGFVKAVRGFVVQPRLPSQLSGVGGKVLIVLVVMFAVKKLFSFGDKEVRYTEAEKKMMMRKVKARKEKEMLTKGAVEVIHESKETPVKGVKKPKLDKEQLKNNILKAKASSDKLVVRDSSDEVRTGSVDMDYKVREIREMAKRAREIEGRDRSLVSKDVGTDDPVSGKSSNESEDVKKNGKQDDSLSNHQNEVARKTTYSNGVLQTTSDDLTESGENSILHDVDRDDREINEVEIEINGNAMTLEDSKDEKSLCTPINGSFVTNKSSANKKPRIIRSVKEAKDYLSKKHDKQNPYTKSPIKIEKENIADSKPSKYVDFNDLKSQNLEMNNTIVSRNDTLNGFPYSEPDINVSEDSNHREREKSPTENNCSKDSGIEPGFEDFQKSETTLDHEINGIDTEGKGKEPDRERLPYSKPYINASEDSNQKEREKSSTENDCSKDSGIEPGFEDLQKSETTLDLEINGIGTEGKGREPDRERLLYSKPDINASEDSNQKEWEKRPTKNEYSKDSGIEPGLENLQKSEITLDRKVNGIGTEAKLSVEKSFHEVEPTIEQNSSDTLNMISDSKPDLNPSENSDEKDNKFSQTKIDNIKDSDVEPGMRNPQNCETTSGDEINGDRPKSKFTGKTENWLETNFHEVEPIIKQIRAGFRDNYAIAKERVDQTLDIPSETESLGIGEDGGELDWMQNEHLRDIVFRVRDNELCGREPFHLMNDKDKEAFFEGLEKEVVKENKKLSHLHEWLHSNIENLDYGADGISIYDSPEKIIPRWKGPSVEKIPESLNEFLKKKTKTTSSKNLNPVKKDEKDSTKNSADSSSKVKVDGSIAPIKKSKTPKTIVEGSDGSVKAGKKSEKEYWQHTKKWSQEFLDCYNAETDPEVKSVMKDIGKDLDRWITEKEVEDAADLMNRLPYKNRSFVEKKLNKLKREMELFGPQAVVSKYREYTDDKEEDYLWWLDLPYVLCIEVYTVEDEEQRIGFYSLEMAPDLELEPKPCHVIAFQDPGDCKNLCYIIQTHMEMLGSGSAFVVARPPKDAFRDAKESGFGVTVIKKGEIQLNIDQPLEEVEEQITEIGSKMYHDKMMKDRAVDINSIMKGVFGVNVSDKRLKRKLK
ncbi:uncharacterized protein LOC127076079 [Lathyrus oleraceus]|uniref:Embryo defective 1703 n=1 Tax=Pisum sativum TaxID=3888 RepID=A0A9D4XNW4_PEA|nr:uncharacterized protein LOC127076079 [Pisum sativum]KAI5422026.1 hypothetical protein KIW84_045466 [Pisum sativum]